MGNTTIAMLMIILHWQYELDSSIWISSFHPSVTTLQNCWHSVHTLIKLLFGSSLKRVYTICFDVRVQIFKINMEYFCRTSNLASFYFQLYSEHQKQVKTVFICLFLLHCPWKLWLCPYISFPLSISLKTVSLCSFLLSFSLKTVYLCPFLLPFHSKPYPYVLFYFHFHLKLHPHVLFYFHFHLKLYTYVL